MPKKLKSGKKGKQAQLTLDAASAESGSIDSQPYVEQLREKFMKHHDPSIMLPQNERLSLEWRDITYRVPVVKRRCCKTIEKREKAILQNVSGYLPSGSLLVRIL